MLSLVTPSHSAIAKTHYKRHRLHHAHALVDRTASYADMVIDAETGRILHKQDADSLRHPASLTKMMTLYLTFQALETGRLSINQFLPVSSNASAQSPSKLGLRPGQRIRVEDAILSIVTESANDSAMVLAEWLGGSEGNFAVMMTRQAQALGMVRTKFVNPTGLPNPEQVTTARDIAILSQAVIYHFPQYYSYFSRDSFIYAGYYHHNHNHLMDRYAGMDGIKTGYIRASGFNLAASAIRAKTRLIGVVFGGRSALARDNHMALLLDQCFAITPQDKDKAEARTVNANETVAAQGDGADENSTDDPDYVTLPTKVGPAPLTTRSLPVPHANNHGNEVSGNDWGVQIGAFQTSEAGAVALNDLARSMPQLLGSATPVVEKITNGRKVVLYRARLMSIDPKTAQAVCAYLVQNHRTCLTVGP